tara:strand:+ start:979 stop:1455 length:477 start_codon:yes stop_codon:yes gene_type:complete
MEYDFNLNIREAKLSDLQVINQFWWDLIREQEDYDSRIIESDLNNHRSNNFLRERIIKNGFFVVEDKNSKLIGIGSISPEFHFLQTNKNIWNIADIWIIKEYRRNKIATRLIKYLEESARSKGAEEIRLTVYSENEIANQLYNSLGYEPKISTFSKTL